MTDATETVTILCVDPGDSVGGTIEPGDAVGLRPGVVSTIHTSLNAGGGRVFLGGRGVMTASFTSAGAAITCAAAIRSALTRPDGPAGVNVRAGIATGDAEVDGDTYSGLPLVEADRLCSVATAGQILVTDLVRRLAGARSGAEFLAHGELQLKGLAQPVSVFSVQSGGPADQHQPLGIPLPAPLGPEATVPFVARDAELKDLEAAWLGAREGNRHVVLVGGEAGAGKTRLVTEFARSVHRRGGLVMYGVCAPDLEVPYQPFAEAFDDVLSSVPDTVVAELAPARTADVLARIVGRLAASPVPTSTEPGVERYRLFEACADLLEGLSQHQPTLLVIDDLHWAGRPTMYLLDHLVRHAGLRHLCIVATYRTTPSDMGDALRDTLPDLRRRLGVAQMPLRRFDRDGVRWFVEGLAGHSLDHSFESLVDSLLRHTDGNAFLLGELWRHLFEQGRLRVEHSRLTIVGSADDISSPETVRDIVGQRLADLGVQTKQLLEVAAVAGASFELRLVAAATQRAESDVLDDLGSAVEARVVEEAGPGLFRFSHALVRRGVEDGLGIGTRRRHHVAVARAVAAQHPDDLDGIAHHLLAGVPLATAVEAIVAARRSAARAMSAAAYENAAAVLSRALPLATTADDRIDLLLALCDACMRAGDTERSLATCLDAIELARTASDSERLVRATLAYEQASWRGAVHGSTSTALIRDVLPRIDDPLTRVALLAALSRTLAFSGLDSAAMPIGEQAIDAARRTDDPAALVNALKSPLFMSWSPDTVDRQAQCADELIALATEIGDEEAVLEGLDKAMVGQMVRGRIPELRATHERHGRLARRLQQPLFRLMDVQVDACLAVHDGRFDDAEGLANDGNRWSETLPHAAGGYGVQMFGIRREQGRLDEVRATLETFERLDPTGAWGPGLVALYAEIGLADQIERILVPLVADDLAAVPRDSLFVGALSYLAEGSSACGNAPAAEVLYRHLSPHRGTNLTVPGLAWYGSTDRFLGLLADVCGRPGDALGHFEAAREFDNTMGSPTWSAHSAFTLGRHLAGRGRRSHDRAVALLTRARRWRRSWGWRRCSIGHAASSRL